MRLVIFLIRRPFLWPQGRRHLVEGRHRGPKHVCEPDCDLKDGKHACESRCTPETDLAKLIASLKEQDKGQYLVCARKCQDPIDAMIPRYSCIRA